MLCLRCGKETGYDGAYCNQCRRSEEALLLERERRRGRIAQRKQEIVNCGRAGFLPRIAATAFDTVIILLFFGLTLQLFLDPLIAALPACPLVYVPRFDAVIQHYTRGFGATTCLFSAITLIGIIEAWLYKSVFESSFLHATPGKLAAGLAVANLDYQRISILRASFRFFLGIISLTSIVGYLMPLINTRGQSLHDLFTGCVVLQTSRVSLERSLVVSLIAALIAVGVGALIIQNLAGFTNQ